MVAPSDHDRPQGGKTIRQRSEFPNASTSSLAHALALFAHMYLSTQLRVVVTLLLLLGAGTHDSDGPRPQCGLHINIAKRTNK
jgi:hypothetical protein